MAVPVGIDLALVPTGVAAANAALVARGAAGVFFLVAALLLYLEWRVHSTPGKGWLVGAVVLLACQLLGSAALALDPLDAARRELGWSLVVDLLVTGGVVAMAALALEERSPHQTDPLLTGISLGLLGTAAKPLLHQQDLTLPVAPPFLVGGIVAAYGALAVAVVLRHSLPRWLAWRLALTLVCVSAAYAAASPRFPGAMLDLVSGTLLGCVGVLWAGAAFAVLRRTLEDDRRRRMEAESSLLAAEGNSRGAKEALHELKSTIAGLSRASELLSDHTLPVEVRQRLEASLRQELARVERRLWSAPAEALEVVDLDETILALLDLHRARGRCFAWTPSGLRVLGRQDAVAEAVNILLDNAATHGDATSGQVAVTGDDPGVVRIAVTDDGPGVPAELRQQIFEWGKLGSTSPDQSIGLHLALRLVT